MSRRRLAITVCLVLLGACGREKPRAEHWSYAGDTGPSNWWELSPAWALCGTGREQSPIDIVDADARSAALPALEFRYQPTPAVLVNNGSTIRLNYAEGSFLDVDGTSFALDQFHFHAPSEHTIDGRHAAMELHLVHSDDAGHLAVVGVLIEQGAANEHLGAAWDRLPDRSGERTSIPGASMNAGDLLPQDRGYYRYPGSLTTPPCAEGATWFVLRQPIRMSSEQIDRFTALYPHNSRPVQPLDGRVVVSGG